MPNRIIKESICYSDDIDQLSSFEENVFIRLIVNADDYGRMDARLSFLKSKLFVTKKGITEKNVEDAVSKLALMGLVGLYEVDGKPFLLFPKWEKHQQIRAKKSKYPPPNSNGYQVISNDCKCPRNPIQSESNPNPESKSIRAREETCDDDVDDAVALRLTLSEIEGAALGIGLPYAARDEQAVNLLVADYGGDWILRAIERTADRPADKRSWGYIKGILRSWREKGGPDDARMANASDAENQAGQRDGSNAYSQYSGGIQRV